MQRQRLLLTPVKATTNLNKDWGRKGDQSSSRVARKGGCSQLGTTV